MANITEKWVAYLTNRDRQDKSDSNAAFDTLSKQDSLGVESEVDDDDPTSADDDSASVITRQPESRPLSRDELVAEVKAIYAGLVMVETKCIELEDSLSACDSTQKQASARSHNAQQLSPDLGRSTHTSAAAPDIPSPRRFSSGLRDYLVKGKVGKHRVDALADTGAENNFVSAQFVEKVGLVPDFKTAQIIKLPGGKHISSPGTVKVPFSFHREHEKHMLDCAILPTCRNDLILSGHFLRITKTLTKFKSRLKESLRHSLGTRLRLNLVGGERHRFWGKLNDEHTLALPDTGSDVMLMSTWWAECNNFNISKDPGHQLELELADGSTVFTSGIVRDATWSFGYSTRTIRSDFYLLDDLDVNVVFSNDFIFELDIYSEFAEFMLQLDPKPGLSDLCNIRLISKYGQELARLEGESIDDLQSPDARKAERVRRDRIRDEINALDPEKRNEAWDKEHQRRLIWDRHRERHENETWIAAVNQQKLANAKACWWKRTFRRG